MKQENKQVVIGIIGSIASGKGTAADYFVNKYKFVQITMSDFLRQEARKRKIYPTRRYLRKLQAELRKENGNNFLAKLAIEKVKKNKDKNFVIDGLRAYTEAKLAKKKLKLKIILIEASPLIRFMRQKKRHRKSFTKTYQEFLHEDALENAIFDFYKTKKLADFFLSSEKGKEHLYKELGKIVRKLKL